MPLKFLCVGHIQEMYFTHFQYAKLGSVSATVHSAERKWKFRFTRTASNSQERRILVLEEQLFEQTSL